MRRAKSGHKFAEKDQALQQIEINNRAIVPRQYDQVARRLGSRRWGSVTLERLRSPKVPGLRNFDHAAWATELTSLSASFVKASSVFFSSASV